MYVAETFLKKSKRRLYGPENVQCHHVPRLNLHVASNSHSANNVLDDLLFSIHHKGFVSTYPIPIRPSAKFDDSIVKGLDPVVKLVKDKRQFRKMYEKIRSSPQIQKLTVEEIENLREIAENDTAISVNPSILALARVCSLDPDPYFSCGYNSYYGGNVAAAELQGRIVVVHTELGEPSKLRLVVPEFDEESSCDVSYVTHQMKESPIYQVDCSSNFILLRQKDSCGLFKFVFDEGTALEKIGIVTTPTVFVSSCFNTFKQDEFATVSPNSAIEIHDVHGKTKRSVEIEGIKDNWGHVHYHDQNVLMFTDRDSVSMCDLRESGAESLQWEVKHQTDVCDDIFAAAKGKFLHYVSTKHHVLSLDIREGFHQRWSHSLPHAPCLLHVDTNGTRHDALLIGCQSSSGIAFLENSTFGDFTSDILSSPLRLPFPVETLHQARIKGFLLSPILSSRFSLSMTGLTSFEHAGKTHVFSCNSVGDLYAQSVSSTRRSSLVKPLNGSDFERLRLWESQCLQQYAEINHGFKSTDIVSLKHIVDLFDDSREPFIDQLSTSNQTAIAVQPWNKSKNRLLSFKDVLAPKLLAHWNIEDEDEWCDVGETIAEDSLSAESLEEPEDVDTRVQKWLDNFVDKSVQD